MGPISTFNLFIDGTVKLSGANFNLDRSKYGSDYSTVFLPFGLLKRPAEMAGITADDKNKWKTVIQNASLNRKKWTI